MRTLFSVVVGEGVKRNVSLSVYVWGNSIAGRLRVQVQLSQHNKIIILLFFNLSS